MTNCENKIRYLIYARKSSESEDRQVQSIDAQVGQMKGIAQKLELNVVSELAEARSAKIKDNRPEFTKMIQMINEGSVDGILCWHINRLARNAEEGGVIIGMLQSGKIKSIQTYEKEYRPEDNVLMIYLELGIANQFSVDLGKVVKRGNREKAEKGWRAGLPPIGYKNDLINHIIIKDDDSFSLVRKGWDLYLTGNYTVPQIAQKLNSFGLRTIQRKRSGGKELALSSVYKILTNKFYVGRFDCQGKEYLGKHEPMITLAEFDKVQMILGKKGKPRPKTHSFPFTGIITCGECGGMVTAEMKGKINKGIGDVKEYTYYHCTKRKKDIKCSQKSLEVNKLEEQVSAELSKYTILPEFRDWALEILDQWNDGEIEERNKIYDTQKKVLESTQHQLDNLTKFLVKGVLSESEYQKAKTDLLVDKQRLQGEISHSEGRADNSRELVEKVFNFATNAREKFINGDLETKKEIFTSLGSNFVLKDQKLIISTYKWLIPIANGYPELEAEYNRLEPHKRPENKRAEALMSSVLPNWQAR